MSHADIQMWWADSLFSSGAADDCASALNDCLSQISRTSFYDIQRNGSLSGDWGSCSTYSDYENEFQQQITKITGDAHFLVYEKNLVDGFSFSDTAALGRASGSLRSGNTPIFIVNGDLYNYDRTILKNVAKQEFLHLVMDGSRADYGGNEHSFGTQYHEGGDIEPTESSPMLTGYTESKRGGNEKPPRCCNQDSVNTADAHNGTLSECAILEAQRWTDNEY